MTDPMALRVAAAQATLDRFMRTPFAWGVADCVRLAAFDLKALGYKVSLSAGGYYKSALGAAKALKRAGFDDLAAAVDGVGLMRAPYAYVLPGDLVGLVSGGEWPALGVALGNGRVLAFSQAHGVAGVCHPNPKTDVLCAWSAPPWPKR